jgi:bacterioferritin-associated ferredoxin
MSYLYASLGCAAKCGRCAHTINIMLKETRRDLVEVTDMH